MTADSTKRHPSAASEKAQLPNATGCGLLRCARAFVSGLTLMHAAVCLILASGCGTTKSFTATEQLLVSDAVDATVSKIDFRPLAGQRAFLDTTNLPTQKGVPNPNPSLVHSDYVSSSLRQQMLAAGVLLCEKREDADIVVEARLGALGFDGFTVTYGLPASNSLSSAASTLGGSPIIPLLPELSFAKKEAKSGAAKLALFAYERQTLQPVWQSGIAKSSSSAKDTWILGIGPLQQGTVYEGTRFAGGRLLNSSVGKLVDHQDDEPEALVDYKRSQVFSPLPQRSLGSSKVETAKRDEVGPPAKLSSTKQPLIPIPKAPAEPVAPANADSAVKPTNSATKTASASKTTSTVQKAPSADPLTDSNSPKSESGEPKALSTTTKTSSSTTKSSTSTPKSSSSTTKTTSPVTKTPTAATKSSPTDAQATTNESPDTETSAAPKPPSTLHIDDQESE